jgi:proline dehydrogenase
MSLMRRVLLAASDNAWLRTHAPRSAAVRRGVSRFMPGEDIDAAVTALAPLVPLGISGIVTHLGENITDRTEAEEVVRHYLAVLDRIRASGRDIHVSVKLTQLGLDLGEDLCLSNLETITRRARELGNTVAVDIEQTAYTDVTIEIYRRLKPAWPNLGLALQAYLFRTRKDIESLLPVAPYIRLVKGAYKEPPDKAFPKKSDVDANYLDIATWVLREDVRRTGTRFGFGTHDATLLRAIQAAASTQGLDPRQLEFQLLYGIRTDEATRLAREGHAVRVLVSYGEAWFAWYMRRLAERPANLWFALRHAVR